MIPASAPHSANISFSVFPAAFNTAKCEKLQKEKEALERRFEEELRKLGWQQQAEVQELQERLQQQFQAESARLQAEHQDQMLRMRCQHQEQVRRACVTCRITRLILVFSAPWDAVPAGAMAPSHPSRSG